LKKIWTVVDLIQWGQNYFYEKNIDVPRLTIELMLCELLGCQRIDLYLRFDYPLTEIQLAKLHNFVQRKVKDEPLQYILNYTFFDSMKIKTDKRALIPRPETELLVYEAKNKIEELSKKEINVLEVGTGTGCIAIALAKKFPQINFTATEISPDSLSLAKENAEIQNISNIDFILSDFFDDNFFYDKFDIIISNPPYISLQNYLNLDKEILKYEPKIALTDNGDGLKFYKKFAEIWNNAKQDLILILEIDGRNTPELKQLFKGKIEIRQDFAGLDRILIARNK
jgi:release factor glutamine methyltransferase